MRCGIIRMSFFVSSWIIIHLGINPDSGGSPPIKSRVSMVRVVIMGVLFVCFSRLRLRDIKFVILDEALKI